MRQREIMVSVQPYMQPNPPKNPGGDCFACALTAAARHLVPENPVDFEVAWDAFKVKSMGGELVLSNSWPTMMHTAPYALREHGIKIDVFSDIVIPDFGLTHYSHAWWRATPAYPFALRLEAWLSAGWIALAEMNFAGVGPYTADGKKNSTDHFVILDGQRHYWKPHDAIPSCSSLEHDTHVVCSAKGAYWINTDDLLEKHGVAGLVLLRRSID